MYNSITTMDIFNFPFLSEIWGTVSDWVMIMVTGITAYFLYKTLYAQKKKYKKYRIGFWKLSKLGLEKILNQI